MKVKRDKVFELMDTYYKGNFSAFARALELDTSHMYKCMNFGLGGGKKVLGAVIKFCKEKGLDYEYYIEL